MPKILFSFCLIIFTQSVFADDDKKSLWEQAAEVFSSGTGITCEGQGSGTAVAGEECEDIEIPKQKDINDKCDSSYKNVGYYAINPVVHDVNNLLTDKVDELEKAVDSALNEGSEQCECCKDPEKCMFGGAGGLFNAINATGKLSFLATAGSFVHEEISKICKELSAFQGALAVVNGGIATKCALKARSCHNKHNKCKDKLEEFTGEIEKISSQPFCGNSSLGTVLTSSSIPANTIPIANLDPIFLAVESRIDNLKTSLETSIKKTCKPIETAVAKLGNTAFQFGAAGVASHLCDKSLSGDGEDDSNLSCENPDNYNELRCQCERGDLEDTRCCEINTQYEGCVDPCLKDIQSPECLCQDLDLSIGMCRQSCEDNPNQNFCDNDDDDDDNSNLGDPRNYGGGGEGETETFKLTDEPNTGNPLGDIPPPPLPAGKPNIKQPNAQLKAGSTSGGPGGGGGGGAPFTGFPGELEPGGTDNWDEYGNELAESTLGGLTGFESGGGAGRSGNRRNNDRNRQPAQQNQKKGPLKEMVDKAKKKFKKEDPKDKSIFYQHRQIMRTHGCRILFGADKCQNLRPDANPEYQE